MRDRFFIYVAIVFVLLSLLPTLWRIIGYDFTLLECLRTSLMDIGVCAVLLFLLATNPLQYTWAWMSLLLYVMGAYYVANWPESLLEWGATLFVWLVLGKYILPRLHYVSPYWIVGLLIGYLYPIRIMGLQMDYASAQEVLEKRLPQFSAPEGLHLICNFGDRYALARERARWFVYAEDGERSRRLGEMTELAKKVNARLEAEGLAYLELNSGKLVALFPSDLDKQQSIVLELYGSIEGISKEGERRAVEVSPFLVTMKKHSQTGDWLIDQAPTDIVFAKKP